MKTDNSKTQVQFLLDKAEEGEVQTVFAYFPNNNAWANGQMKIGYSTIGQHCNVAPDYAAECTVATPEQYAALKAELESIGYNLEIIG